MKILVVVVHPNLDKSFNHELAKRAVDHLKKKHEVKYVDLYKQNFVAAGGPVDFTEREETNHFDYQSEQKNAVLKKKFSTFSQEIREQIELVRWCDYIFFQFPLYWFSIPAMLQGWMERVLAYHWAYGGEGAHLKGKKICYCFTTGGPGYQPSQINSFFKSFDLSWQLCGVKVTGRLPILGVNFTKFEHGEAVKPTPAEKENWKKELVKFLSRKIK